MNHPRHTAHIAAPADEVWATLANQRRWSEWSGFDSVEVLESSELVTLRVLTSGEVRVREWVRMDPLRRRFSYRHLEGLPVQRYVGEIALRPSPSGTLVDWRAQIEPLNFGGNSIADVLNRVIEEAIEGLAKTSETQWRNEGWRESAWQHGHP